MGSGQAAQNPNPTHAGLAETKGEQGMYVLAATGCRARGMGLEYCRKSHGGNETADGRVLFVCVEPRSPEVRQCLKSRSRHLSVVVRRFSIRPRQHQSANHRTPVVSRTDGRGQARRI